MGRNHPAMAQYGQKKRFLLHGSGSGRGLVRQRVCLLGKRLSVSWLHVIDEWRERKRNTVNHPVPTPKGEDQNDWIGFRQYNGLAVPRLNQLRGTCQP